MSQFSYMTDSLNGKFKALLKRPVLTMNRALSVDPICAYIHMSIRVISVLRIEQQYRWKMYF